MQHVLGFIPSPPSNGIHIGPLFIHYYGLMYVIGITLAVIITRRRWQAMGGNPDLVGDVAIWAVPAGLIGGQDLLRHHHAQRHPAALVGRVRHLVGRARDLGGHRGRGCGRHLAGTPGRRERRPVCQRHRPGAAGRPGGRPRRQLFQSGAVREAHHAALGSGDLPGPPAGRVPRLRDLPADVPVRDHLGPGPRRLAGLAGQPPADPALGACSPCTWPGTRRSGSSRSRSGSIPRSTSSACASTSTSRPC